MSVSPLEVKRCFVLSDKVKDCVGLGQSQFRQCVDAKREIVLQMSESLLNMGVPNEGRRSRVADYDRRNWRHGTISTDQTQIFVGAGELPPLLTLGSVRQVAAQVEQNLATIPPCRGKTAIPGIISMAPIINSERMLSVIALPTGDPYPGQSPSIRWHLDDGSMRAIGLAMSGNGNLNAFIGTR